LSMYRLRISWDLTRKLRKIIRVNFNDTQVCCTQQPVPLQELLTLQLLGLLWIPRPLRCGSNRGIGHCG
ncbi:MAG: hypothetical protein ACKPKO_08760, partial [Candidatus Fonsibacter sp.]